MLQCAEKKKPTLLGAASSVPHLRSLGGFSSLTTVFFGQLCVCAALLNCTRWSQFKSVTDAEGCAQPFLRKARSDVWVQFMRKKDVARCNLCGKEYKYTSSTSNLQKHLRTAHPDVWKEMDHDTLKTKPITSWVVSKGNSQSCSPAKGKVYHGADRRFGDNEQTALVDRQRSGLMHSVVHCMAVLVVQVSSSGMAWVELRGWELIESR